MIMMTAAIVNDHHIWVDQRIHIQQDTTVLHTSPVPEATKTVEKEASVEVAQRFSQGISKACPAFP